MNKYRVWYSYTKPDMDCPEVLYIGENMFIDVECFNKQQAIDEVNDSYLSRMHENFKTVKCEMIEEDSGLLKNTYIDDVKYKKGVGASLLVGGVEVVVVSRNTTDLEVVSQKIFGDHFELDKSKVLDVLIRKDETKNA